MVADHVGALTEHELHERMMQEELEALAAGNLAMRKQILGAQNKQTSIKDKAKNAYI